MKKTISRKNVRVLFEKICIFHSNSFLSLRALNNSHVFVLMFQDNDEDVVKVLRSASNLPCKAAFLSLFGLK